MTRIHAVAAPACSDVAAPSSDSTERHVIDHDSRSPLRIYIAGAKSVAPRARHTAMLLRCQGYDVVSRWHHTIGTVRTDPCSESERICVLTANLFDMNLAHVVLALTDSGEPRATLVEIGVAIGWGRRVIWQVGADGAGRNLFDSHALVTRVTSAVGAFQEIRKLTANRRTTC
jgi:hypothetical protein